MYSGAQVLNVLGVLQVHNVGPKVLRSHDENETTVSA